MVCLLRSSVVLSSCLLAAVVGSPETVEAQSHRRSYHHSGHQARSHRVSRVRGHRHGSHRLHRGYVQGHLGHRDHPSTYYPSYSPHYNHDSGPRSHERHSYSYGETHSYGNYSEGHAGYTRGSSYGDGYSSCSSGYSSGGYGGYSGDYSGDYSGQYYGGGSHVSYEPWGATVYGYRNGRYMARAYVASGNRQWLQGPATYLNTKRAVPWRAHVEQAIDDGAYDDLNLDDGDSQESGRYDGEEEALESISPGDRLEEDPAAAPQEPRTKRGRLEYRDQDQDTNQESGVLPRPRSETPSRITTPEAGQRSTRLKRLLTLVSAGSKGSNSANFRTPKRGQIHYPKTGKKVSNLAKHEP